MKLHANWSYPTDIRFGAGRISELPEAVKTAGIARPLLVTDPGLAGLAMIRDALAHCQSAGLGAALFSDMKPNPTGQNVTDGVAAYRAGKHDGVIAFGGGSALDCGKAIAFAQGQSGPLWDYEDIGDQWSRANGDAIAPVIAVPTTAGTGSEVGRASVILDEDRHEKKIIFHPKMMPVMVISDPELTLGLPPTLTAGAGVDAFVHCLEAWCAPTFHPMSQGIALEGMRLVKNALETAVADGSNIEARAQLLIAASMGATAFQKGLGAVHSLSHAIGALYDTHHGMTNAVMMPYVLVFNRPAIEEKIALVTAYLGIEGGFDGFMQWVLDWRKTVGVPHSLKDFGVDNTQADLIAKMAANDPTAPTNPVELTVNDARRIFEAAYSGALSM
jgi:alcohol dehydrogenase